MSDLTELSAPQLASPRADRGPQAMRRHWTPKQLPELDPNGLPANALGAKLDAGKPLAGILLDFSLALRAVVAVGTFGANKYARGGWQEVDNGIERYTDAMLRHALKEPRETHDPDSGLHHAAHLAWNALARLELMLREEQP